VPAAGVRGVVGTQPPPLLHGRPASRPTPARFPAPGSGTSGRCGATSRFSTCVKRTRRDRRAIHGGPRRL